MNTLNIAFIDDGINSNSTISKKHGIYHYKVDNDVIIEQRNSKANPMSHGTLCFKIFNEFGPDCNIYDLNIASENKNTMNSKNVNIALKWCINNNIQIISMSLGALIVDNVSELVKNINHLNNKGIILVASCSNTNKVTYPASLSNVIGVRYEDEILKNGEYFYVESSIDGINIITSIPKKRAFNIFIGGKKVEIKLSNSFAASYIASKICLYLSQGMTLNNIKKEFRLNSEKIDFTKIYQYYEKRISYFKHSSLIDVPIIGVMIEDKLQNDICKDLQSMFRDRGYVCGIIDMEDEIAVKKFSKKWIYKYNISIDQLLNLIVNSNIIDVLLISVNETEVRKLLSEKSIDLLLKPESIQISLNYEDIIDYSNESNNLDEIFDRIVKIFDS